MARPSGAQRREERLFVNLVVADVHNPWAVWIDCDADLGRPQLAAKIDLRVGEGRNHFRLFDGAIASRTTL
jgi:hypothetical protein